MISNHTRRLAKLADAKIHTKGGTVCLFRLLDCIEALADSLIDSRTSGEGISHLELGYSEDLGSLIIGCYWSIRQYSGGQSSQSYRILCKLGNIFSPGHYDLIPAPGSSGENSWMCLNDLFEAYFIATDDTEQR